MITRKEGNLELLPQIEMTYYDLSTPSLLRFLPLGASHHWILSGKEKIINGNDLVLHKQILEQTLIQEAVECKFSSSTELCVQIFTLNSSVITPISGHNCKILLNVLGTLRFGNIILKKEKQMCS